MLPRRISETIHQQRPHRLQGHCRTTGAILAEPRTRSRTTATRAAFPQCTSYSIQPLYPAIQGKTTTSMPPLMYPAPPCDYKRRRQTSFSRGCCWLVSLSLSGFSFPRGRSGTIEHSSEPTPLLAETWGLPSLSRLACIPCYKHSGCKIIQCPRAPPLLDVRPRGRNQDKPHVTVLPLASSSGTRKHAAFTSWDPGPLDRDTDSWRAR